MAAFMRLQDLELDTLFKIYIAEFTDGCGVILPQYSQTPSDKGATSDGGNLVLSLRRVNLR